MHIAIIMDGNGRWAKLRGLPRSEGHRHGLSKAKEILYVAKNAGVAYMTFYAFSSENWKRSKDEVAFLMSMCESFLKEELSALADGGFRFKHIGRLFELPVSLQESIARAEEVTKNNTGLGVQLAFNYGARLEIIDAVKKIVQDVDAHKLNTGDITEEVFSQYLYTKGVPDPDLLIRTSGEQRISNFLLWQSCYTEFYVTKKCWPDFSRREFLHAIKDYKKRTRRFGGGDD
jgi:undecaprenyl diphosphate synthase